MSADNWAQCPRCWKRGAAVLAAQEVEVKRAYGLTTVDEFDRMRAELEEARRVFEKRRPTFREDYEFSGAETGTVDVDYHGECTECGLKLSFEDRREIPGWGAE